MKRIIWAIPAVILVSFLGAPVAVLKDVATGLPPQDMHIVWSLARYAVEPLAAFGEYVLSFSRYIVQLLSWMGWIAIGVAAWGLTRRAPLSKILKTLFTVWTVFLTMVVAVLLLPLPAPRLAAGENSTLVDLHSHTLYSHDGVMGPRQSIAYHRRLGFDLFFDSEHNHTRGFAAFPSDAQLKDVLPGMQISTTEKLSLLILSDRAFDGAVYANKTVKELIDLAHANGCVVICPHWWKWRHFSWQELADRGIDGFEVYNAGYRNFSDEEQRSLIAFCRDRKLLVVGSTDWHGWGHLSNVWTVLDIPKSAITPSALIAALSAHGPSRVVVYSRPERPSMLRYVFEPFAGLYGYFGSMTWKQTAGWVPWILASSLLPIRRLARLAGPLMTSVLLALSVSYLVLWLPLKGQNFIIPRLVVPVLLTLAGAWFAIWRMYANRDDIQPA